MSEKSNSEDLSVTFHFQSGLTREQVTLAFKKLTLKTLKEQAVLFVNRKLNPDHGVQQLHERLLLFKHDYSLSNVLKIIDSAADIRDGVVVEVVVSCNAIPESQIQIRPHALFIHSYKSPTFCDHCGEMLFGLVRQGLKCEGCGLSFHKRCAYKVPNNCSYKRQRRQSFQPTASNSGSRRSSRDTRSPIFATDSNSSRSTTVSVSTTAPSPTSLKIDAQLSNDGDSVFLTPSRTSSPSSLAPGYGSPRDKRSHSIGGRSPRIDQILEARIKVPHTFVVHSYTKPTMCQFCKKLLKGLFKQGLQCKDCKFNCHKKCGPMAPADCTGEPPKINISQDGDSTSDQENEKSDSRSGSMKSAAASTPTLELRPACALVESHSSGNLSFAADFEAQQIPVQRLVQSIRQTKRVQSTVFKEGWMTHFTNRDGMKKRHYWRLDSKTITLYQSNASNKFYKEIALGQVLSVENAINVKLPNDVVCSFIMKANVGDNNIVTYYVGDGPNIVTANEWQSCIKRAMMPVSPTASEALRPPAIKIQAPDSTDPYIDSGSDISQFYQIFTDEVLGSGQFGVVYGGVQRETLAKVAVKVIDKLRFPNKQEEQLKTEVAILQKLDHPGVVKLHRMFETPERIFVVMQKLQGDMLEMILSSERSRLSERITKFLVFQILSALRYLHMRDIVHCDLKPENVLLTSNSDFPQTKLCDFGFARIIGEKSFRRSVVGTPAYLAPEVLRNKRYNRALDCWSAGVIIYVSLSGTFPFNEDEDISDQIQDANFMFPPNPWSEVSKNATNVITKLLVVKVKERLTVSKAIQHEWLNDYQLYCDLRAKEAEFGWRYLTHESDDIRWEKWRQEQSKPTQDLAPAQKDYFMEKYYCDDFETDDGIKEE